MKEVIRDVLDLKVPMKFYETVEEGDTAAGRTGAVLDECNNNLAYRGSYADARDMIVAVTEELSGLTPNTKKEKKGDKEIDVVDEKESVFVARVLASGKVTKEDLQAEVEKRARDGWTYKDEEGKDVTVPPIAVDIKARVRVAPKPPKLSQEYKNAATALLAQQADDGKINKTLAKFLGDAKATFARSGDTTKDVESLGWLIRDYQKAKLAAGVL